MTRPVAHLVSALVLAMASAALAGPPEPTRGDPHSGSATWQMPPPVEQADRDGQIPPAATGAIFVPAMTDPQGEPAYLVKKDGVTLVRTTVGRKTWVAPGTYRVLVGSGVPENMLEFEVDVVDGRTTFVPVEWSGLVVTVTSQRGTPFRGSYELVRLPEREYVGLGLGADIARGETLPTWLLRPGKYMILAAGESYRARKNFVTLRLVPGELVSYTLVLDESTGDLLGAGEVETSETVLADSPWSLSMVLGGSVQFNRADNVIGKESGMSLDISGFFETVAGYRDPNHIVYSRLYLEEEGTIRFPDQPYLKVVDELDLDLLYMYRLVPWFGPYGRFSMETHLVPGYLDFETPTDVRKVDRDGRQIGEVEKGLSDVEITPSFSPLDLRYGIGGRFDVAPAYWVSFSSRLGVGGRHVFANGLFIEGDQPGTPELDIARVADLTQFGAEGSLVGELRVTRWVQLKLELDILMPFDDTEHPVVDFRGQIALRLATFASLNYVIRIQEDIELQPETQLDQAVLLRFTYKIF